MSRKKTTPDIVTFAGSEHPDLVRDFVSAARGASNVFEPKDCVLSVYPDKGRIVVDVSNQSTGGNLHVIWDAAAQSLVVHKMRNGDGNFFELRSGQPTSFVQGKWRERGKEHVFQGKGGSQFLMAAPHSTQYFEQLKAAVETVSGAASQSVPQPF